MAILICGLNGSGKSTVGAALAEKLGRPFLDVEDLYFPKDDPSYLYAHARSGEEVTRLLEARIEREPRLVFASVRGDFGPSFLASLEYAVLLEVPRQTRLARVRERSYRKFGARMEPGGDLYEKEAAFFDMIAARPEDYAESWVRTLRCPVLRIDGARPVGEIVRDLAEKLG